MVNGITVPPARLVLVYGLTVEPGIPLGVVGDIDSIFTGPVLS